MTNHKKIRFERLTDEDINIIITCIPANKNAIRATDFFKLAKTDRETAYQCFRRKDYTNSIYHLQQAVEKATKSFGFYYGLIDLDDAKKISHRGHLVFLIFLKVNEYLIRTTEEEKNTPIHLFALQNIEKMEEFRKRSKDREYTYHLIDTILVIILDIERRSNPYVDKNLKNGNIEEIKIVLDETESLLYFIIEMMYLAFITEIHESYSRYVDENNDSPLNTYSKGNPIVDNLGPLLDITKKSFQRYNIFMKNPPGNYFKNNISNLPPVFLRLGKTLNKKMSEDNNK